MRLSLQPADDAAHGDWLRGTPGAYEWWYFDAVSDDGDWAMTTIWFLGNPFSPYYRLAALGKDADPYAHNALYFALYFQGKLCAYHFTRFAPGDIYADDLRPAALRFGPNTLQFDGLTYTLHISDENANRRTVNAVLTFTTPPLVPQPVQSDAAPDTHSWLPAAPACHVAGQITLHERHNPGAERLTFRGHGYHDHNWGALPFHKSVRDWYWARVHLSDGTALLIYHVRHHGHRATVSHLLRFDGGRLTLHDPQACVTLRRWRVNGFGTIYATRLHVQSNNTHAAFYFTSRLDSAPFYIRTLCEASITQGGETVSGAGLGEYFRPRMLAWPLVASATKARIVNHGGGFA